MGGVASRAKKPRLKAALERAATSPTANRSAFAVFNNNYATTPSSSRSPRASPIHMLAMDASTPPATPPLSGRHASPAGSPVPLHRQLAVTNSADIGGCTTSNPRLWPPIKMSKEQAEARSMVLKEIKDLQVKRQNSFKRIWRLPTSTRPGNKKDNRVSNRVAKLGRGRGVGIDGFPGG